MLVMMEPDCPAGAVELVRAEAQAAGFATTVFEGRDRTMISLAAEDFPVLIDRIAALAGVAEIVPEREDKPRTTSNLRIAAIRPLIPPSILVEQLPLDAVRTATVQQTRREASDIINGRDDRLIVVVGPCSVHDCGAALDYARRLAPLAEELAADLRIIMRVYFEKPRTTVGWQGLINDPHLDESFAVNEGLQMARRLLLDVVGLGLPAGCEFLDPISPQFFADAVSWGAIGARTTESQVHRNLASGLSMPIGFKNGTEGNIQTAIDALAAAAYPHQFLSVTEQGLAAIVATRGNRDTHVILRGGTHGSNYDATHVQQTLTALRAAQMPARVMIDTSHGNSGKDYRKQPGIAAAIAEQIANGERGIVGLLLESFLVDGKQQFIDRDHLVYGQSITDSCMGWEMTVPVLRQLAAAVRARRIGKATSVAANPSAEAATLT